MKKINYFNNMINKDTFPQMLTDKGKIDAIKNDSIYQKGSLSLINNGMTNIEEVNLNNNKKNDSQNKLNYVNPIFQGEDDIVFKIVKHFDWVFSSNQDSEIRQLDNEEEFDNINSSLMNLINKNAGKININNNYSELINRDKTIIPDYYTFVDSKKKNNYYQILISYWANFFKEKNISIDEKKIVYWELDGSKPVIYLDNGVILSLDNDKLTVKDYFSDIGYNYALSDDKKYILNSVVLNNGSDSLLEFDYTDNNLIIKDLTKEDKNEQILFDGNNISDAIAKRKNYKNGDSVNKIDSIEYYKDDYGNESLYLSNGYLLRLDKDNIKVMDRVDQLTEIAKEEVKNNGEKYRNWFYGYNASGVNWCSVFISWLYSKLPGNEQFFSKLDDYGNITNGQDGAGDVPRKSVDAIYIDKNIYGEWHESEFSNSGYTPKVGDIVLFTWNGDGHYDGHDAYFSDHIGYVYEVDDEKIYTIEGNVGNNDADLSTVKYKEYDRTSGDINGYYSPYYNR